MLVNLVADLSFFLFRNCFFTSEFSKGGVAESGLPLLPASLASSSSSICSNVFGPLLATGIGISSMGFFSGSFGMRSSDGLSLLYCSLILDLLDLGLSASEWFPVSFNEFLLEKYLSFCWYAPPWLSNVEIGSFYWFRLSRAPSCSMLPWF